jgi:hypothetical protein
MAFKKPLMHLSAKLNSTITCVVYRIGDGFGKSKTTYGSLTAPCTEPEALRFILENRRVQKIGLKYNRIIKWEGIISYSVRE